jgi:decaprenylphospho-beta-D-erythro-pentofuranosid-2-ulose 2-reductase
MFFVVLAAGNRSLVMRRIIVLGATTGIAQALERLMAAAGLEMLLVGRSKERLDAVQADLLARGARSASILQADLADTSQHTRMLRYAAEHFADFDTLVLAYGSMLDQAACQVSPELAVRELNTNFTSAVSLLTLFGEYFRARGSGTIAVITSVAGDRGRRSALG